MKIQYKFADETVEIEVADEWGELIVQWDRDESSADRDKRRHSYSLDSKEYEGSEYGVLDQDIETFGDDEEPSEEELLLAGLDLLSKKQREVIRMYFFDGITLKEIGAALGTSEAAACALKNRAIEKLKNYFRKKR